jgi:hypothetical protein
MWRQKVLDLDRILRMLAEKRPIFHSEADFQHALAWEIHIVEPAALIRLELPVRLEMNRPTYLDLLVQCDQQRYAIELKYKTSAMATEINGENFLLSNRSAQDAGRYDFLKDVVRLEQYVAKTQNSTGYAIFLSNDSLYWNEPRRDITSVAFSIHDTRQIHSGTEMCWAAHAGSGSTKGRERPIVCKSSYSCSWKSYSSLNRNHFKCLLVKVGRSEHGL